MSTKRKTALVTGAARGIGLGIARALAEEDCDIAIADLDEEGAVSDAVNELEGLGAEVLYCRSDISVPGDRAGLVDSIRSRFGHLEVLVNNAGVGPKVRADVLEATEESFERLVRINLEGPYFLTQLVARWMIEQRKERPKEARCVVNISSISATVASPSRGDYCISKAGLSMATKLWAARLAEFDIPVYEVRPGIIKTDMTAPVREKYDLLIAEGLLLMPRWGLPEDVGKAVAMMVRGDVRYSTGQVVTVDGGLTLERL